MRVIYPRSAITSIRNGRLRTPWLAGALVIFFSASAPALAATEFLSYEGRDAIHEGQGGNRKMVDGVEFWISGDPPRRFQVLGAITDSRHETGIWGAIRMSSLDSDIAKAAKNAGGDAVILTAEGEKFLGTVGFSTFSVSGTQFGSRFSGDGSGTSFDRAMKSHEAQYVVVKYLPDESAAMALTASAPAENNTGQAPASCSADQIRYAQSIGVDCHSLGAKWP